MTGRRTPGRVAVVAGTNAPVQALPGGVVLAAMNTAGPLLTFVWRDPDQRWSDAAPGFAAGGVLFVTSDETLPATHANGSERVATGGTMMGWWWCWRGTSRWQACRCAPGLPPRPTLIGGYPKVERVMHACACA